MPGKAETKRTPATEWRDTRLARHEDADQTQKEGASERTWTHTVSAAATCGAFALSAVRMSTGTPSQSFALFWEMRLRSSIAASCLTCLLISLPHNSLGRGRTGVSGAFATISKRAGMQIGSLKNSLFSRAVAYHIHQSRLG